jgi:hypothetical protein
MRVLLVGAEIEENLAVRYLWSALEAAGHVVTTAPFAAPGDAPGVLAAVRRDTPELVGLSVTFQRRAHEFGRLATALREAGFAGHLTCGGHFATFAYESLLGRYPALDSAVRHEGEQTLPALCAALAAGGGAARLREVAGLVFRDGAGGLTVNPARPLCPDLDALPVPRRDAEAPRHLGIPTAFLVGSRGCYGHCTFCCIHAWLAEAGGPRYRARSVANLADEMASLRHDRGVRLFIFHDDDFFTRDRDRDLARMTALRDALARRRVRDVALVVKARPDDVDPDVFAVLQQIGLLRVYLGIESGSTQGLRTLGRGVDLAQNRAALARLVELGVYACFNLLLFDPDSTLASLAESLDFVRRAAHVPMNFCRTEVYVGTPIMRRLAREGRLLGDEFGWDYHIADPRAEAAFRLFARTFHDRNFRADGLMNSNLGLGYHLHLLRRFYPHAVTPRVVAPAEATIARVNLDAVGWMERILAIAAGPAALDEDTLAAEGERLAAAIDAASARLEDEVEARTRAIIAVAHEPRARATRTAWRTVAAAASLALPLAACGPRQGHHPPPDPVPPPSHERAGRPDGGHPQPPPPDPVPAPTDAGVPRIMPPDPPPPPPDPPPPPHREKVKPRPRPMPPDPPPPSPRPLPPDPVPPPPDPPPPPHTK